MSDVTALLPELGIILAAFGGFLLAYYLHHKKQTSGPMICPLKGDCASVIKSEYSSFFGIPVELIGMAYYVIIAVSYAALAVWSELAIPSFVFLVLTVSAAAFLFSAYLTFIQVAYLRQICTWCLVSAGLCTVIFSLALFNADYTFTELLAQHRSLIGIFHLIGLALGLGAATTGDIFFFRFLKDLRISHREADTLRNVSQVVWLGLALLIISGVMLYLPQAAALHATPKFLAKMIVVTVITINGAFLNLMVTPQLIHISFGKSHLHAPGELHHKRKIAFALGAVSFVSWYTALILGALRSVPLSFSTILLTYGAAMLMAVIGSQIMEHFLGKQPMPAIDEETT